MTAALSGPIQLRYGTAASAASSNPTLKAGEKGLESDTGRIKTGDGATTWNALPCDPVVVVDWAANTPYKAGALVVSGGVIQRRKTNGTSGATFDVTQWDTLGSASADDWLGYASTLWTPQSSVAFGAAGRLHYARVIHGKKAGATVVGVHVTSPSGNIMVGVYRPTGSGTAALPGALALASGVVACPAAGYKEVALGGSVDVAKGDYLVLWCDNTTATFGYLGSGVTSNKSISGYYDLGNTANALPASIPAGSVVGFTRAFALNAA